MMSGFASLASLPSSSPSSATTLSFSRLVPSGEEKRRTVLPACSSRTIMMDCGILIQTGVRSGNRFARLYVLANELHDIVHRGAGLEDSGHTGLLELRDIDIGDDAAYQHQYVIHFVFAHELGDARHDGVVCA